MSDYRVSFTALGYGVNFAALDDDTARQIARAELRRHRVRTRYTFLANSPPTNAIAAESARLYEGWHFLDMEPAAPQKGG